MNEETHYYQHDENKYLSADGLRFLVDNELIMDGTEGGLIIGPRLVEGGVTIVNFTRKGEYCVNKAVDGWVYLLNAYALHHEEQQISGLLCTLQQHNSYYQPYNVPEHIKVFDATPRLVDGQQLTPFIFTGSPETGFMLPVMTKFHLERIDQINRQAWQQHHKGYRKEEDINVVGTAAHFVPRSDN